MPARVPESTEPPGTADLRREQMLNAALEVISARGYADTRISDVADLAGVSPALVIYYFKSKDQLLTEAIRHYEDDWYALGQARMAALPSAAARIEEFVALNLLPADEPEFADSARLWLDFWAQAARNTEVAAVRQKSDERWREVLASLVRQGQEAGEFSDIDATSFAVGLSALVDGLTIQIALNDPLLETTSPFELCMHFVAERLGFSWAPGRGRARIGR